MRPTQGRLDLSGMMGQAPSSDTTGWFARDGKTFARVSAVLLGEAIPERLPTTLLLGVDAFGFADPNVGEALQPMVDRLSSLIGEPRDEVMAPAGLSVWTRAQRTLQPYEGWLTFKDWIDADNPRFAFSVARNLVLASMIPESDRQWAELMRIEARARLRHLLPPGTILCLPTTPFPAPLKGLPISAQEPLRQRISVLTSHGGLTGVPQVSLPGATVNGLPVGLSIIGSRDSDASLVAVARAMGAAP
jgi:amidase